MGALSCLFSFACLRAVGSIMPQLRPVSLAFTECSLEDEYQHDTEMNDVRTLRFFFKFMYLYVAIRLAMEFFGVSALPINITFLKLLVICASHLYTFVESCRGWHLRTLSLLTSYLIIDLIVRDPAYPGFYFVLVENQIIQGILFLRKWKSHILFCSLEMSYLLVAFARAGVSQSIPRLTIHILGLLILHTGGIWVYEREIRMRWLAQRRLSQQEHRWKTMMALLSDPVLVSTSDQVVYANAAAKSFLSRGEDEIMKQIETLVCETQIDQIRGLLRDAIHGRSHTWEEFSFKTSEGEERIVEISSTPVDWDGAKAAMLVGHDVTEVRRTQRLKDSFLAACSHELRTPLNSILGMLEMIRDHPEVKEVVTRYATVAFQSGQHLLNLINDILDLSKIAAGKFELNVVPLTLLSVADETLDMISYQASQRDIAVLRDFDARLACCLLGDPCRFRQVLLNLLSNAIKFTMNGEIRVKLELLGHDRDDWRDKEFLTVRCAVSDTGVGIKETDLDKLFSVFGRIKSHNHLNPSGSGLGLALCKELCAQMGGDIGVQTEWGKGSTFWFTVQARRRPEDVHKALTDCRDIIKKPLKTGPNVRSNKLLESDLPQVDPSKPKRSILLVEDNEFNIAVMTALLRSYYDVTEARNGAIAVDLFKRNPGRYDLILMDCQMPVMDGFEATRLLVEYMRQSHVRKTPIVGLTAFAMQGDKEKCLNTGMDDYLAKPVAKKVLYETISYWITDTDLVF
eukprot:GILK01002205.1.p1 GENE.GILK01002205.1~~GILK01002205.1.p1  ORF type:complete len:741 (-),score=135.83 GILK01002205.1:453-2675(-)